MDVTIRPAKTHQDLQTILSLAESLESFPELDAAEMIEAALLAFDGARPVAACIYREGTLYRHIDDYYEDDFEDEDAWNALLLDYLLVQTDHQRRGVGTQLLNAVKQVALQAPCCKYLGASPVTRAGKQFLRTHGFRHRYYDCDLDLCWTYCLDPDRRTKPTAPGRVKGVCRGEIR